MSLAAHMYRPAFWVADGRPFSTLPIMVKVLPLPGATHAGSHTHAHAGHPSSTKRVCGWQPGRQPQTHSRPAPSIEHQAYTCGWCDGGGGGERERLEDHAKHRTAVAKLVARGAGEVTGGAAAHPLTGLSVGKARRVAALEDGLNQGRAGTAVHLWTHIKAGERVGDRPQSPSRLPYHSVPVGAGVMGVWVHTGCA
jgi:hypothetical protein